MNAKLVRIARVPLTVLAVWALLSTLVPTLMAKYAPYVLRPGFLCQQRIGAVPAGGQLPPGICRSVSDLYQVPAADLFVDSMFRSLALLVGAAVLALVVGTLLGTGAALWRRHVLASGALIGLTAVLAAVPAFFVAYFLQVVVIVVGASAAGGNLLPVYGFGWDRHVVLPLLSISLPAITYTAQLTATRMIDVLDADFVTAANAKGLAPSWILAVHVLPHVRPVLLEALGSGLRVSVASLPIVEFLFQWRGIGQLSLEAVGVHDAAAFVFGAVVLAALFATLSAVADLSRPRALYERA
jgi:peptide/nickel transport system permease protein